MKKCGLFLLGVWIFLFAPAAFAQNEAVAQALIDQYTQALAKKDDAAVNQAWEALSRSEDALMVLKKKHPKIFRSYEFWRIKRELEELRSKRFLNSTFRGLGAESEAGISRPGQRSNDRVVNERPNQNLRSNRRVATSNPNQDRRSNSDATRDFSNSNQLSNQERIRNRLRGSR